MKNKYYNREEYEFQKRISKMENVKTGDYIYAKRYIHDYEYFQEAIKEAIKEYENK
jgi:hypothetical protein